MLTQKSTLLIVDDDHICRETLELVLANEGYHLEMAENGRQALEKVLTLHPDVVLLDVMMPDMTGFEVCRAIRSAPDVADIPVIIITSLDDQDSLLRGLESGADDFINKPFDRYELRARLASLTRLNRYRKLVDSRKNMELAYSNLLEAYEATIEGWSRAMDLRDKETEGHSLRVTSITLSLGKALGMHDDQLLQIRRGALLHDIGKLGIPDAILFKEGALTDEEWVIMRKHPVYAFEMLSPIKYLHLAIDIPYCHHEKWDGSGYPRGLKGNQIPFSARIFAVVDVWDAITSDRLYRPAWNKEKALKYILDNSGSHFDPQVVKIFPQFIDGHIIEGLDE